MNKKLIALISVSAGALTSLAFNQVADAANVTNIKSVITTKDLSKLYDDNGKLVSNRALAKNSDWYTDQYVQMDNVGPVYRVSTHEFVKASDVTVKQDKVYDGVTVANTGVAHITYASSYGADVFDAPNGNATGDKLSNGTSWKFTQKVVDPNGDAWYQVGQDQWLNGATSKISNESFDENAASVWDPNYAAVRVNSSTPVYSDSNFNTATSQSLPSGKLVQVVSTVLTGNTIWYEISDGGWLPSTDVSEVSVKRNQVSLNGKSKDQVVNELILVAKEQLGKPYVWNGKGPDNFDCSGLMQYVFRQVTGQNIGGWTVPQESIGSHVAISDLQPGDLVFWGDPGATYHVGLYIGDNQYLNALRPGTNVKIDGISSSFAPSFGVRVFG
ncbi:C40 family peptidase [Companilactobacillus zhongbaensis]|uniref:C40 family peptidase n=1 Tax=Companilactobacillus zhongbaensis TaxID=2486009 RepID=UPI000F7678B7|nr:C40 family peptidase [Companilactobacillus zhongbaensis]